MKELVLRAQKGDEQAFTELILEIKHDLYKIAKTRLVNNADVEDAVQDTMIEAFNSIKKLKNADSFRPWIEKILRNRCNKLYNKRKRKKEVAFEEEIDNYITQEAEHLSDSDMNFYLLLKCLDKDERTITTLYYLRGYTTREISQDLKMNENTVKTKLARAKIKIKNNYKEEII